VTRFHYWPIGFRLLLPNSGESGWIPAKVTGFRPKLLESCQNHWNPAVLARSELVGRDPAVLVGIFWPDPAGRESGQIRNTAVPARWLEYDHNSRRNLGWPDFGEDGRIPSLDSGDIDWMLSDFDTDKISVIDDCLNVKVDCIV
jgi:hypothetical protein